MQSSGIFRVMLIVGILANIGIVAIIAGEKKETGLTAAWKPYTSTAGGFSLTYPQGWRPVEYNRHDTEIEARFCCSGDTYVSATASLKGALVIDMLKHDPLAKDPLGNYHEMYVGSLKEQLRRFKGTESAEVKVAGMKAYSTTFEFATWNGLMGRSMKGIVVSTWNGDNHIALQLICPAREYDKMLNVFGAFLQSFKPKKILLDEDEQELGEE